MRSGESAHQRPARTRARAWAAALVVAAVLAGAGARPGGAFASAEPTATRVAAPADAQLPDPLPTPDEARNKAKEILAGNEYKEPDPSVLERFLRWVNEQINKLFRSATGSGGSAAPAWILLAVLIGVAGFLLSRVRWGTRRRDGEALFETELEAGRSATTWLAEASRFEQAGEWRLALRCRYRALVGELRDRDVVRDLPGRTSGEFRVEVAQRAPQVGAPFDRASALFDAAWYGDEPTGPAESAQFQDAARVVLAADAARHPEPAGVPS